MSLLSLCGKIENHLTEPLNEVAQSKTLKRNLFTDWDCKIKPVLRNLLIPLIFALGTSVDQTNPRVVVKWDTPEDGWSKVNFDGASAGNPGQSGISCILRDSDALSIKEISEKIGVATNNEAKFRVALKGLKLGKELGVQRIHLEGELLNVINAIHYNSIPSWRLNQWLQPILALLSTFDEFWVSHIYREANGEADRLSKLAIAVGDPT
ncbi:uncharacterized protein LOC131067342 [Cryptomeria japonica]|uniref:uncharacterized protein LOC131067342 n=1 Tax=Cryptomeria japonica TaxID=3369 RepID=UPI0027D9D0DF|nr:uncharacterized protein LOC131067342 [Cryptomeria japonica]